MEETIAISSQMMNHNNFRIVLEEIFKISNNIDRSILPKDIDNMSPENQVSDVYLLKLFKPGMSVVTNA